MTEFNDLNLITDLTDTAGNTSASSSLVPSTFTNITPSLSSHRQPFILLETLSAHTDCIRETDTPFPSPPSFSPYSPSYSPPYSFESSPYILPPSIEPDFEFFIPSYLRNKISFKSGKQPLALPTRWDEADKSEFITVCENGLEIKYTGPGGSIWTDAAGIRTNCSISSEVGLYYFEVTILDKGERGNIGVGLGNKVNPLNRMPGWDIHSIGYHGDDGLSFMHSPGGNPYGPLYSEGDTVGCGINFYENSVFFTKNGTNLGYVKNPKIRGKVFPMMGLISQNECVEANFGAKPFVYDISFHAKMVFDEANLLGKQIKLRKEVYIMDLYL